MRFFNVRKKNVFLIGKYINSILSYRNQVLTYFKGHTTMITFIPLTTSHFTLLLKWLNTSHVKKWWDKDVSWTEEKIAEKYLNHINDEALEAYIVTSEGQNIGYLQSTPLDTFSTPETLPEGTKNIDFYIGEESHLGKKLAPEILKKFMQQSHTSDFITDPDSANNIALKTLKRAGFHDLTTDKKTSWLVATTAPVSLVNYCMNHETPYRGPLYHLCHDLLKQKKPRSDEEDLAFLHSFMGLGLAENDKGYFKEALSFSKKMKQTPPKTIFWLHMGLGNSIIREQPEEALHAFKTACELAQQENLGKSLVSIAEHKIHSANHLIKRKST